MKTLLFVIGKGGPAPEYALPKLVKRARVFALPLIELSESYQQLLQQHGIELLHTAAIRPYQNLVATLVNEAKRLQADAIFTFSEFALCAVSEAATQLGLKGVGENVVKARSKIAMRTAWKEANVPVPNFVAVRCRDDLSVVEKTLKFPILLKSVWGAGSVGQDLVASPSELNRVYDRLVDVNLNAVTVGFGEYSKLDAAIELIAEELIDSTTESWYDIKGYGDYLSVEGVVVDGVYHPVCITSRLPTIFPYTELANLAPCPLPEPLQRLIEVQARKAVDALGLDNCGTHTEFKLMANNQLCLLETAARLPGAMVCREVEEVFAVDLLDCLLQALLNEKPTLPSSMLTASEKGAAASIAAIATNASGQPWGVDAVFSPERIEWQHLLSEGSSIELVKGQSIPSGSAMPVYDGVSGVLNFAGLFFLKARTPAALRNDAYAILDHLKHALTSRVDSEFRFTNDIPDEQVVSALCLDAELNGPWHEPDRVRGMLEHAQYMEFAYHDSELIGFIRVLTDFSYNAFIADLAVHPAYQSRGLGAELIHRATAKYPCVKFVLQAGEESHAFYAKRGFEVAEHSLVLKRRF